MTEIPLGEALQRRLVEVTVDFLVAMRGGMAWAFWLAGKLSAMLANVLVEQSWWNAVRDALLAALQEISQPMLRDMLAGGLLYVVLMLAGIVMLMPMMTAARFLKVDRIILWTVVLVALFVSSTLGFDLIGNIEKMRVWLATAPLAGAEPGLGLGPIVALPMRASDAEMTGFNFNLPREFEDNYYQKMSYDPGSPDYRKPTKETETLTVTILGPFKEDWEFETQSSLARRNDRAWAGLMRALLMLPAAYVALQFGVAFAVLSVAALLLIAFLVACLPIGFFEFGATLLGNIIKQYLYVVALTLLVGLLARIVSRYVVDQLATVGTGFDDAAFFIQFQVFIPLMILAGIAVTGLVKMSWGAMTGTLGLVGNIGGAVGAMAAQRGPEFGPLGATISTAGKVAASAAVIGAGGAAFLGMGGASLIGGLAGSGGAAGAAGSAIKMRQVGTALTAAGNVGSLVTGGRGESVFRPMRRAGMTMRSVGYMASLRARGMSADESGSGDNGDGGHEPAGRVPRGGGPTPATRYPSPATRHTPSAYPLTPRRRRRPYTGGRHTLPADPAKPPTPGAGVTPATAPQPGPPQAAPSTGAAASAPQQQAAPVSPAAAMGPVDAQGLIVNNASPSDAGSWGGASASDRPRGMGVFAGPEVAGARGWLADALPAGASSPPSAGSASPPAPSLSPAAEAARDSSPAIVVPTSAAEPVRPPSPPSEDTTRAAGAVVASSDLAAPSAETVSESPVAATPSPPSEDATNLVASPPAPAPPNGDATRATGAVDAPSPAAPPLSTAAEAAHAPSPLRKDEGERRNAEIPPSREAFTLPPSVVAPPVKRGRGRPRKNAPPGTDVAGNVSAAPTPTPAWAEAALRQAADALDAADVVEMTGGAALLAASAPLTFAIGETTYQIRRARYRELRAQGRTPEQIARQVRDEAALKQASRDIAVGLASERASDEPAG